MMKWKFTGCFTSTAFMMVILSGCWQSDYTKLVKRELKKGVRQDSIVLGIYFGKTRDEFYGKCFDLNRDSLVTEGPNGATVQYLFTDSTVHDQPVPMRLLFIPQFDENDIINEMNFEFSYVAWAPWNDQFHSDKLIVKVQQLLMEWYKGNAFVMAEINGQETPVKVDGNRRMIVYIKDAQNVVVKVQDILHPKYQHSISK